MTFQKNISLSQADITRIIDILSCWHKIEFFIPFDLDSRTKTFLPEEKRKFYWITNKHPLPEFAALPSPPLGQVISRYELFLGVFDKNEITAACRQALGEGTEQERLEDSVRTELEGNTCYARISLNEYGEPVLDNLSISTVPWALGMTLSHGLESLSASSFEQAKVNLANLIMNFEADRRRSKNPDIPAPITDLEISELCRLLFDWAGFRPNNLETLAIRQTISKPEKKQENQNQKPEDEEPDNELEIDILNSFYIEDIERVMHSVRSGTISKSLYAYLNATTPDQRIDLYSQQGRQTIINHLDPEKLNLGHWFDERHHTMSLMQQFAINTAFKDYPENSLFSVNGPPGTGKTTLLRDIFAENIVRRARKLSCLSRAAEAFQTKAMTITIGYDQSKIRVLKPEFTGYEMVVASTNNAAVNNISQELPKQASIGKSWHPQSYLKEVATKVAAQKKNGKLQKLTGDNCPWGMISCALGNKRNRENFRDKFFFYPNPTEECKKDFQSAGCMKIWDWIAAYDGPTFKQACANFKNAEHAVSEELNAMQNYINLLRETLRKTEADYTIAETTRIAELDKSFIRTEERLSELIQQTAGLADNQRLTISQISKLRANPPGFFARLFRTRKAKDYNEALEQLLLKRKSLAAKLTQTEINQTRANKKLSEIEAEIIAANTNLETKKKKWQQMLLAIKQNSARFKNITPPLRLDDIETDKFQISGLWENRNLAALRTELFRAALTLHEAWLADVGRNQNNGGAGFAKNLIAVSNMLVKKKRMQPEHALAVWQSLFMVVPVVSTTFASFGRQFTELGQGSIGWLFIDEAGQGVPQAAAGAL
ncbi:MAG TPA: hypothetical protein DCS48_07600, partial [Desulfovibrio sp.]|nr:hypothetical protein [Desulfovibrio sp.]